MLVQIQTDRGDQRLFILYVMFLLILPYNFSLGWEWEPDFKTLFWGMDKLACASKYTLSRGFWKV